MKRIFSKVLIGVCMLSATMVLFAEEKETMAVIDTNMGKIKVKLFNDTPLHRDNFIKNVREKRYDGTLFHRVINLFMIQGGDFNSKGATEDTELGEDTEGYTIPAEFVYPKYFHKRGMLCAARTGDESNPEKASSPAQFYIVTGKHFTEMELDKMEQGGKNLTPEQREAYMLAGGTPHLDAEYTIFGEVLSGIKVVEKIQMVPVGDNSRPLKDVQIKKITIVEK